MGKDMDPQPITVSPEEFEREVMILLEKTFDPPAQPNIRHREFLDGMDGTYEIDLTVKFRLLGVDFLVVVECKKHKNPIKRETVQVLHDRIQSTGAQKGIIFSTSSFQRGAIEYASKHGIALIMFISGKSTYFTRAFGPPPEPPPWAKIPKYSGWLIGLSETGGQSRCLVSRDHIEYLRKYMEGAM